MIACLSRVVGLCLMPVGAWAVLLGFGMATLNSPDPPGDWWVRYWAGFWRTGGPVWVVLGGLMVLGGGWLVVSPTPAGDDTAATPGAAKRPAASTPRGRPLDRSDDPAIDLDGDPVRPAF